MSWSTNGFFRNVNVVVLLNSSNQNDLVLIYKPGTLNVSSLTPNTKYSGFVTSLRASVDISSIGEVALPARELGISDDQYNELIRGVTLAAPRKLLELYLGTSDSDPTKVASAPLFNRQPYYSLDLLAYLTDAAAFDIASDCSIYARIVSDGFGVLSGDDRVAIVGSAVEEVENSAPSLNITVISSGSGTSGGSAGDGSIVINSSGDIIVSTSGDVVTT